MKTIANQRQVIFFSAKCVHVAIQIFRRTLAFTEWKVILQGRTSAAVLSVVYHWFQFWYASSFVSVPGKSLGVKPQFGMRFTVKNSKVWAQTIQCLANRGSEASEA